MGVVIAACCLLVIATSFLHYEALGTLHTLLPRLRIPGRAKLFIVVLVLFVVHASEIGLYGLAVHALIWNLEAGALVGLDAPSLTTALYFSAQTYTSLGFGDLVPVGALRLLVGFEALNGLLLIGWSASFTYLSMERFWPGGEHRS